MLNVLVLLLGLSLGGSLPASDATDPLTIEFYSVSGDTARKLGDDLDARGPVGPDGSKHHGYTRWDIRWSYRWAQAGQHCELRSFDTELRVAMTLPEWDRPEGVSSGLAAEWERYSTALRAHEQGHYDIAVAAVEEIKRRIPGQTRTLPCASLGKHLDDAAGAVLEEFRRIEQEYDEETAHGATQGARFRRQRT